MRRKTVAASVAAVASVSAVAIGIALGASGGTPMQSLAEVSPRLPVAANPTSLPSEATPGNARTALSPDNSLAGRAVAAILPPGETVKGVQAVRVGKANYDLVDARRLDGSGLEVNLWRAFAPEELDADVAAVQNGGGRYWPAADDAQLQSLYYQSATGVAVRVAHYSAENGERLTRQDLVNLAIKLVDALTTANNGRPPVATIVGGVG